MGPESRSPTLHRTLQRQRYEARDRCERKTENEKLREIQQRQGFLILLLCFWLPSFTRKPQFRQAALKSPCCVADTTIVEQNFQRNYFFPSSRWSSHSSGSEGKLSLTQMLRQTGRLQLNRPHIRRSPAMQQYARGPYVWQKREMVRY